MQHIYLLNMKFAYYTFPIYTTLYYYNYLYISIKFSLEFPYYDGANEGKVYPKMKLYDIFNETIYAIDKADFKSRQDRSRDCLRTIVILCGKI